MWPGVIYTIKTMPVTAYPGNGHLKVHREHILHRELSVIPVLLELSPRFHNEEMTEKCSSRELKFGAKCAT